MIDSPQASGDGRTLDADRAKRLDRMSSAEIDAAVIMPVHRYLRPHGIEDTRRMNDVVASYRDQDPDHFPYAVGITEPTYGEVGLAEIERIDADLGMIGVSYHTRWQGVTTDDPWVRDGLECMEERRLLPFVHAFAESTMEAPYMVCRLAARFPDMPFVITDALSSVGQSSQFLEDARRLDNLYFDTSCAWNMNLIRLWVQQVGAARLIFGSDTYSSEMVTMHTPGRLRDSGISEADAEAILSKNFLTLLDWTRR
jgi:uncharacterized protein